MSQICIEYDCPVASISTQSTDKSFFCTHCQKNVQDFTSLTPDEFDHVIPTIQNEKLCGIYRLDQVNQKGSKLHWKTKLNMKYEYLKHSGRHSVLFVMVGALIFLSGCRTKYTSGYRYQDPNKPNKKEIRKEKPAQNTTKNLSPNP